MKQIITQHGWCLNSSMWKNLKDKFKSENFYWQDNERGYYCKDFKDSKWIENTHGKRTKPGILTFCIDENGLHNLYKCEKKVWK